MTTSLLQRTRIRLEKARTSRVTYLAVCAVIRDEAKYIEEWLEFHLSEGVEHFVIYDDNSSDDVKEVLLPWVERGIVTLREASGRNQDEVYTDCVTKDHKKFLWVAFIDIDEFLFSPSNNSLPGLLSGFEGQTGVFVFWKLFGSRGLEVNSHRGVVEDCTYSLKLPGSPLEAANQIDNWVETKAGLKMTGRPIQGKSIVQIRKVKEMGVHLPSKFKGEVTDTNGKVLRKGGPPLFGDTYSSDFLPPYNRIVIHHYWSRSLDSIRLKFSKPGISKVIRDNWKHQLAPLESAMNWDRAISQSQDLTLCHRVRARTFPYIFVIGFNKTATRSLAAFFNENGLPAIHWDQNRLVESMLKSLQSGKRIMSEYESSHRVYADMILETDQQLVEGNQFFREMYFDYPGSFFILNNRSTETWLKSRVRHNNGLFLRRQLAIMGSTNQSDAEELWRKRKKTHEDSVRDFFRVFPGKFLEIDIEDSNVPQVIKEFLGIEMDESKWRVIGKTE